MSNIGGPTSNRKMFSFLSSTNFWIRSLSTLAISFLAFFILRWSALGLLLILLTIASYVWVIFGAFQRSSSLQHGSKRPRRWVRIILAFAILPLAILLIGSTGTYTALAITPLSSEEIASREAIQQKADAEAAAKKQKADAEAAAEKQKADAEAAAEKQKAATKAAAKKKCSQIIANINFKTSKLEKIRATLDAYPIGSDFDWLDWYDGFAQIIYGPDKRDFVSQDLQKYFPETYLTVTNYVSSMPRDEFLSRAAWLWGSDGNEIYLTQLSTNLDLSLLAQTGIDARTGYMPKIWHFDTAYPADFVDYVKTQTANQCDYELLSDKVNQLFHREKTMQVVSENTSKLAFEIVGCELTGKMTDEAGLRDCAGSDSTGLLGYEVTQRNPFLSPFKDKSLQDMAAFSWCWNLGRAVNSTGTGCE